MSESAVDFDRFEVGEKIIYVTNEYESDDYETPRQVIGIGRIIEIDSSDEVFPWLVSINPKHVLALGKEAWMRDYNVFPNVLIIEEDVIEV